MGDKGNTLDILEWPHPILRSPARPVTQFDQLLQRDIELMWRTMYEAPGIGLAAPQVGDHRRIFIMDCGSRDNQARQLVCINPEIHHSHDEVESTEGCLSFPGLSVTVPRTKRVKLKAQNIKGEWFEVQLDGLEAICAQHELDHLEGRSFLDLLGPLEKIATFQSYLSQLESSHYPNLAQIQQQAEEVMNEFVGLALRGDQPQ